MTHSDRVSTALRLQRIPTTIACDILKDQALGERVARSLSPIAGSDRLAGPARIIEFLPGCPELRHVGPPANFAMIDALEPGDVLVLCVGGDMTGAVLGDMLATRARQLGAHGAVVDGAVRDLEGLALSGLPVHALGVAPLAAHGTLLPHTSDRPTRFAGITVLPDDWILADRDGVLCLTRDLVDLLLTHADTAMAKDELSRQLLLMGFPLTAVFPLPRALMGLFEGFRAQGHVPDAATVRAALATAAG